MSTLRGDRRVGVLIVRLWVEPSQPGFRARVTTVLDLASPAQVVTDAHTVADIQSTVRHWVDEFLAG